MSFTPFTTSFSSDGYVPYFNADAYGEHVLTSSPSLSWNKTSSVLNVSGALTSNAPPVAATVTQTFTANPSTTASSWTTISSVMSNWPYGMDCSTDGRYIITDSANGSSGTIAVSRDYGNSWTLYTPAGTGAAWRSVACSGDGSFMIAVGTSICYTSTDYGATWTSRTPGGGVTAWNDCDCTDDGYAVIVNTTYNTTFCQVSSNWGASWSSKSMGATGGYTTAVAISSLGFGTTGPVIAVGAQGKIWRSKNGGNSWGSYSLPTGNGNDRCITMDYDGSHIAYGSNSSNAWYLSTNSGDSWTQKSGPVSNTYGISMDAYGEKIIIGDYGNYLYLSTDGGSTWSNTNAPVTGNWAPIVISKDGYTIAATRDINGTDIYLYRVPHKFLVGNTVLGSQEFSYGATLSDTLTNIVTAFNNKGGNTTATKISGTQITYTANAAGQVGNAYVAVHVTDVNNVYSFSGSTLSSGLDTTGFIKSTGCLILGSSVTPTATYGDVNDVIIPGDLEVKSRVLFGGNFAASDNKIIWDATNDRLGIGTASPNVPLEVYGTSSARIRVGGGSTGSGIEFNDANNRIGTPAANELALYSNGSERIRIDSNGNVGIGYTSISSGKLCINGNLVAGFYGDGGYRFTIGLDAEGNFMWCQVGQNFRFSINTMTSPSNIMTLTCASNFSMLLKAQNGKCGIATSNLTPANLLSVNGGVSIGSSYYAVTAPTDGLIVVGKVGIGCSAVPYGSTGIAALQLYGTYQSANGPHIQCTSTRDAYPLLQIFNWDHDNINLLFDCYSDAGTTRSSSANSNVAITKYTNYLAFGYATGVTAGQTISTLKQPFVIYTSSAPTYRILVSEDNASVFPMLVQKTTAITTGIYTSILCKHITTDSGSGTLDGFGTGIAFQSQDTAGVGNNIGFIGAVRDGTDDSGRLVFYSYNTGSGAERMSIKPDGKVGIGTIYPNALLTINGVVSLQEQSAAPSPDHDGYGKLYTKTDGSLYFKSGESSHVEYNLLAAYGGVLDGYAGGGGIPPGILDGYETISSHNDDMVLIRTACDGYSSMPSGTLDGYETISSHNSDMVLIRTACDGYGAKYQVGPWEQDSVAASQSAVALYLMGSATRTERIQIIGGSIIGVVVYTNDARTAGTLTVEVTKNGSGTGLTAVLDGDNTTVKVTTQAKETDTFAAGDRIGVALTTDSSWAPTTADITVEVLLEA